MLMFIKNLEELTNGLQRVELFADSEDDLDYEYYIGIDKTKLAPGSRCVIANGDIYFLNTQGEWVAAGTPSPRPPSPTPIETSYIYNDIKYSTNELQMPDGARQIALNKLTGKSIVEDDEIKSVNVTKFTVDDTDYPVSFTGKSANNAYDELDLVNKKYIQRIGSFDLSSLGKKSESSGYIGWEIAMPYVFQANLDDDFNIKLPLFKPIP